MTDKVGFMLIGAQKCATTFLSSILETNPNINFSQPKETHYFSKIDNWESSIDKYHKYFSSRNNGIKGEGSTTYTAAPHVNTAIWNAIYQYNPDTKFIYLVRNPYERFVSHYMHMYQRHRTTYSINEAYHKHPILTDSGRYAHQIQPFIELFGADQVLIVEMDDLVSNIDKTYSKICRFIGVHDHDISSQIEFTKNRSIEDNITPHQFDGLLNSKPGIFIRKIIPGNLGKQILRVISGSTQRTLKHRPELSEDVKSRLLDIYIPDIKLLEKIMKRDLSHWVI